MTSDDTQWVLINGFAVDKADLPYTFTADEEKMLSDAADLEQADAFMTEEELAMLEEWEMGEDAPDPIGVTSRYYLNNL